MKRKKLLIDANPVVGYYLNGKESGIGRTCRELIMTLDHAGSLPFDIELYSQNMKGIGAKNLPTHFKTHHLYLPHRPQFNRLAKSLALRELLTGYDLMHVTHNYDILRHPEKCILTIHDAMFMRINDPTAQTDSLCTLLPPLARQVRHIFTCSECSKKDIVETMGVAPEKVTVVYWGIDHTIFHRLDEEQVKKRLNELYGINRSYLFSVSCNPARKRIDKVVQAYIELFNRGEVVHTDLVLAWGNMPEYVKTMIEKAGPAKAHIKILGIVSDEELCLLYNGAKALFFPSEYEGFGLPLIEAMACGTPVVTCRNSCLDEIAADAGIYLDEPVETSIRQTLIQLDQQAMALTPYIEKGLERCKQFTWENAVKKYIGIYTELLK